MCGFYPAVFGHFGVLAASVWHALRAFYKIMQATSNGTLAPPTAALPNDGPGLAPNIMRPTSLLRTGLLAAAVAALATSARAQAPVADFNKDVRPILEAKCVACHGAEKHKSGLRLDRKADAFQGGDGGPAIVAGKSAESELIRRITSKEKDVRMPPKGDMLTNEQVDTLKEWIDAGAVWPDDAKLARDPKDHWGFKKPVRPAEPATKDATWARNPIDKFVLDRLEKEGLKPAPETDKATLLRRARRRARRSNCLQRPPRAR